MKCVTFVGEESFFLASGDGDGDVKLWLTNPCGAGTRDEEDRAADENGDADRRRVASWGRHDVRACGDGLSAGGEAVERRGMENDGVGVRTQWSRKSSREEEVGAILTLRASGGKGKVRILGGILFTGRIDRGAGSIRSGTDCLLSPRLGREQSSGRLTRDLSFVALNALVQLGRLGGLLGHVADARLVETPRGRSLHLLAGLLFLDDPSLRLANSMGRLREYRRTDFMFLFACFVVYSFFFFFCWHGVGVFHCPLSRPRAT